MNKINKVFTLILILMLVSAAISGASAYFGKSVSLGISDMETKVFDLQVKLRSLTTGELISNIRGWDGGKMQENFSRLSPPTVSYAFGIDYLMAFLISTSSSAGEVYFSGQDVKFPNITFVGMSVKKGVATLTLNVQGNVQMWVLKYENGKWKAQDVGYLVEDIEISKDQVSFLLSVAGQKRKYEFPIAAVPAQYAAP